MVGHSRLPLKVFHLGFEDFHKSGDFPEQENSAKQENGN
jgi:hypothetical protein